MNGLENQTLSSENNLKTYLEQQIKEYTEECENTKAMYVTLLDHIKECKAQIHSLKGKEDNGFAMLSPIPVKSAFQTQIIRMEGQLESFEKQREKYTKDMRFYEGKIEEMKSQLEAFYENNASGKENEQKTDQKTSEIVATSAPINENPAENKESANYEYIAHKIAEIKSYINVDIVRSKMELDRLEKYVKSL